MGKYKPYSELMAGKFFTRDSENVVVISTELLRRLNIVVFDKNDTARKSIQLKNKKRRYLFRMYDRDEDSNQLPAKNYSLLMVDSATRECHLSPNNIICHEY